MKRLRISINRNKFDSLDLRLNHPVQSRVSTTTHTNNFYVGDIFNRGLLKRHK